MQVDTHLQQRRKAQGGPQKESPASPGDAGQQFVLRVTYVLTAVELTCLFMQFSIMPYLAKDLGLDSVGFGYLQTLFGVLQLLGGPIFGRFADQWGARAALTLSFLAASGFYLLISFATNVPLLVVSRIPAMFMHVLPGAQMVITDMTSPADRPAALGKLGLCFGIGVILGSMLGGTLNTKFGIYSPAYVAFLANAICTLVSLTCIPANTKATSEAERAPSGTPPAASVFDLKEIARLLALPGVGSVFFIKILSGFPSGLFMIMFSIISMNFFELEAAQAGYLMSYSGVLQMVVQGLVVGQLTERYSEDTLLQASIFVFSSVGLAMALMTNVFHFCLIVPGLVFSMCIMNIVTDSMLTKSVPPSDTGAMLGICASVQPLTRTIGPTIGGLLYKRFGVAAFGHLQFAVNLLLFLYLYKKNVPQNVKKSPLSLLQG
ncbi:solute carrier family 67 member A1 isoform X2 [Phascolarctos cinereus]|nr:solute carrier family 22 member 18 isoform X2 [Phascolarctos cinereus]XP_020826481.1 solute carrier family 22 member 18 isoform X2 [Phascolarctos cinereus]